MNRIKWEARAAQDRVVAGPFLKTAMQKADRREKRRLLDAQRGKCRVRLGSHLDEWCVLKDHLGFSLHSQLAKFLLDSYRTTTSPKSPAPKPIALLSASGPSLQRLAFLCHQHGRNCNCPLSILAQPCSSEVPETRVLLWGCKEDHQFYWDPRDCSAELDGDKTKEDVIGVPSPHHHRTTRQENVAKKTEEYGPVINIENKVNLQRTAMKPHSIAIHETLYEKQSGSDANSCPVNVDVEQEQCNNTRRITEHTLEERQHMTPGNELPLKPDVFEQQQKPVTVTSDGLSPSIGLEILVSSAEIGDTEEEDAGLQSVGVSEDTKESFSIDLVNEQPKALCSGQGCRHQRCHNQPSQSHQQALKPELPFICRRSPRGRKGSRTKADVKEQVSHSKVQLTSVSRVTSDVKGQVVGVHGSPPNTNLTKRISHMEETLTEDVTRRKTPSENFEGLAADEEQKEPLPAESQYKSAQTSRAVNREQDTQMEVHENEELHNNQCKEKKTSRCKSIIDEELAQICKKRIRKATPQELLMCEYDDCGKIFSKRQYLNYHQKYQHMNQRTFRCSVTECGKTFNFKKHLKEHEKRHSDQRDFICEFCARAFRSSSNLLIHRRIHTGEKPLQCEFCGFTCRQKASLNWHMKKHDADSFYRFPCDICGQRFEKRDNLAAHKSRKHPLTCETAPQDASQSVASSIHEACHVEASCEDDHTEGLTRDTDQEMILTAPEVVQETLFPQYLDLTESVQEPSQQSSQTPGNAGISLVIVL